MEHSILSILFLNSKLTSLKLTFFSYNLWLIALIRNADSFYNVLFLLIQLDLTILFSFLVILFLYAFFFIIYNSSYHSSGLVFLLLFVSFFSGKIKHFINYSCYCIMWFWMVTFSFIIISIIHTFVAMWDVYCWRLSSSKIPQISSTFLNIIAVKMDSFNFFEFSIHLFLISNFMNSVSSIPSITHMNLT